MHKLSWQSGDGWVEHSFDPMFKLEALGNGTSRIVAGVPGSSPRVLEQFVRCLQPPYIVLYVLHTPRGEGEAGRYQSPALSGAEFDSFLGRFERFFAMDSRFDLWVHAPNEDATVVWDRHNLIHGYGPIDRFTSMLRSLGFQPGAPSADFVHAHHYHSALDADAAAVLGAFEWHHTPLEPADEQ